MSDNWNNAAKKIGGVGLAAVMAVGSMGTGAVTALAVDNANPATPPSASGDETTTTSRKLQTTYGKQTVTYEKTATETMRPPSANMTATH